MCIYIFRFIIAKTVDLLQTLALDLWLSTRIIILYRTRITAL